MSALNPRPIVFPLSNPVRLSECEFHEAVQWSRGTVLFASGSPFPEQEYGGRVLYPGQGASSFSLSSYPTTPPLYCPITLYSYVPMVHRVLWLARG